MVRPELRVWLVWASQVPLVPPVPQELVKLDPRVRLALRQVKLEPQAPLALRQVKLEPQVRPVLRVLQQELQA
jgi:hypothetical protein